MADEIRNHPNDPEIIDVPPPRSVHAEGGGVTRVIKRISWAAIFSGVLVALATELLFTMWGFFIGFRLGSPDGVQTWSLAWYIVTAFASLLAGGWVAARLSGNPNRGSGMLHGIVTWGLTTVSTFAIVVTLFSGILSNSATLLRTATMAAAVAPPAAQNEASRQAAGALNQMPNVAANLNSNLSIISLILFGGILAAAIGSLIGGAIGRTQQVIGTAEQRA